MWLRDALPYDITFENDGRPAARVMIYGYESKLPQSNSFQDVEDLATTFHSHLIAIQQNRRDVSHFDFRQRQTNAELPLTTQKDTNHLHRT